MISSSKNKVSASNQPKYQQIVQRLRHQIESGILPPGQRMATFEQLRSEFGLTNSTIEKVYGLLEQEGLIARRRGAGTFVLGPKKPQFKGVIGLSGYGFSFGGQSSYWTDLVNGVRRGAHMANAQILLLENEVGDGWEKVDGLISSDFGAPEYKSIAWLQLPFVSLFGLVENVASIATDDYEGGKLATEHLLELGHRRIAYLHGRNLTVTGLRRKGYIDALDQAGVTFQPAWRHPMAGKIDYGPEFLQAGRREMEAWLDDSGPNGWKAINCTALLCHNDETAIGAMQALTAAGFNIPTDVSIVGYDGTDVCEYVSPSLTSVQVPLQMMGEKAVELLLRQIAADQVLTEHHVLPLQLRVGKSTAPPRI